MPTSKAKSNAIKERSSTTSSNKKLPGDGIECKETISEEEAHEKKRWLQHNSDPKEQVRDYMKATTSLRMKELKDEATAMSDFLNDWPRLLDFPGMIEVDFRNLFGQETSEHLTRKWTDEFAERIFRFGAQQKDMPAEMLNEDGTAHPQAVLQLLPMFLPTGKVRKASGKSLLATRSEAVESFIDQKPSSTNLPGYLDEILGSRERPQPFILLLGERCTPSNGKSYVIVEGRAIMVESLLKAVDTCFKVIYVLDLHYPNQCATTWEFIQKVIFEIGDQDGKNKKATSPCVRNIRAYLNNCSTSSIPCSS
ncbi:uncharacterized protein [Amphiura filiformis]|uniref:uncharacterized protein n=1 Tax=Amphiura filiformis TaxID=82378 RepID=UPI003B2149D9